VRNGFRNNKKRVHNCEHDGELRGKDIEELKVMFTSLGEMSGGGGGKSDVDPHKVCQLDAETKRLKLD
jgi:hypothetical protein